MIKNKYKKIVSAILLMTMIATTFSVDVFAGGEASCITINCEGVFKDCCKPKPDPTPKPEIENKVVTDPITPPAHQPEPVSTHNDNQNYKFNKDTGQLTLLSNYKGTEPIATYMDKSQLESIKTVNIERGVVRLVGTFQNCYNLTTVTISDTVKEIGENAFAECKDLYSVNILSSVTEIGARAFQGCTHLESIKIPASVTKIGAYAFKGCTNLTEVIIPDSVTEISEHAFDGCPVKPHKSDPQPEQPKSDVVIDPISPPTSFIPTEVTKVEDSIQTSEPEVVIDPISPPTNIISTETDRMDNSIQASEEVVIDSITLPTNIILTEADKVDNSVQASEEIAKVDNSIQACEEIAKVDNSIQVCEEIVKVDNSVQTTPLSGPKIRKVRNLNDYM